MARHGDWASQLIPGAEAGPMARALAGCSHNIMLMVSWRGALAWCSGASGAMLEVVDPLPLVLLGLPVD